MGLIKAKQVNIGSGTPFSGSFTAFISASAAAAGFGTGTGTVGSTTSPWLISGGTLYTSQSFAVEATGSLTIHGNVNNIFLIKSINNDQSLFKVTSDGIATFYVNEQIPTSSALYGQLYFTSQSVFVGLV